MEEYKKKYEQALENLKKIKAANKDNKELVDFIEYEYPELKESEDERIRRDIIRYLKKTSPAIGENIEKMLAWLEKPKYTEEDLDKAYKCADEVQYRRGYKDAKKEIEKQGEKIDAIENLDTEFEKQVSHLIASAINKEHEYNQSYVKWTANALLNYAKQELEKQGEQKYAWNQEDEDMLKSIIATCKLAGQDRDSSSARHLFEMQTNWLKSLKERMKGE